MRIRKRFRVLILAAAAATIVVPVSLSFTLDQAGTRRGPDVPVQGSNMTNAASSYRSVIVPASITSSSPVLPVMPVMVIPIQVPTSDYEGFPDAVRLVLVGTLLVGAAAAVRKSS